MLEFFILVVGFKWVVLGGFVLLFWVDWLLFILIDVDFVFVEFLGLLFKFKSINIYINCRERI